MNFKLDFDIDGTENSFVIHRLKSKPERPDWLDEDEKDVISSYIEQEWVLNEDYGRLNWPENGDATYLIGWSNPETFRGCCCKADMQTVNNASLNRWGSHRGYRVSPGAGSIHRTVSAHSPFNRMNSNHAKTHLAISKRKETEPSSSAAMNQNLGMNPLVCLLFQSTVDNTVPLDDLFIAITGRFQSLL
jgi:primary-amine oxidase